MRMRFIKKLKKNNFLKCLIIPFQDSISSDDSMFNYNLARWETQATLAELDKQIEAFDNLALDIDEEEDSSICLDNSSYDGTDASIYQQVSFLFEFLRHLSFLGDCFLHSVQLSILVLSL